ncbi:hypothetical protein B0H63DRAFT_562713 [Podospora didyma]|uniref:DUF7580 domain-containing protein n=1 Tax=Podospora didyma TaxID=330526 RepID=A0AAE0KD73_9PEZI|nr:hypothetical protein B0H63DRAFT_562713 [Podospora didyma]
MDPISLGLGIAPLCLAALTGTKCVKKKLKLFRHHHQELSGFRKRLTTLASLFRDECRLLPQDAGIDCALAEGMLEDLSHRFWTSPDLEEQLQDHLGRKYIEVKDTSEQINEQMTLFDKELSVLEEYGSNYGKLSAKAQQARNAIGVTFKKANFEAGIESLTELITEFMRVRKTAKAFQKPKTMTRLPRPKTMPQAYGLVARHSTSFYQSLVQSWSCQNFVGTHSAHAAKLFLDTDSSDECVIFRLILEYQITAGSLKQHSLLLLIVRSEDISWVDTSLPSTTPEEVEPPRKVRRVRFAESSVRPSVTAACSVEPECHSAKQPLLHNLCTSKEACIGYLTSKDNLRHSLLTAPDKESTAIQTKPCSPTSLASTIQPSKPNRITVNEQLRLTLRLTRSVLQYHATTWWRRNWNLSDLCYFDIDTELSTSFSTLHIDTKLLASNTADLDMQALLEQTPTIPDDEADDDVEILCGIRNVTFHSLGVALLQIGRWEILDTEDIVQLRKIAKQKSRLGPRYDKLTAKCLYCDFGSGDDLNEPDLQRAVYANVVCVLEHMVRVLEGGRQTGL